MISLDDAEMRAILDGARPLPPRQRDGFLRAVASELSKCRGELGPGAIHRVVRETQRQFFDPPNLQGADDK
jgi:hypothetical protein